MGNQSHFIQNLLQAPLKIYNGLFEKRNSVRVHLAVFIVGFFLFGAIAVQLGQDNSWELKNHRIYNAFAFLHGRLEIDQAPAQIETFQNPMLEMVFYSLINNFSPRVAGFLMGGLQGLTLGFLFALAFQILYGMTPRRRFGLSLGCAMVGMTGPIARWGIGSSASELLIAPIILAGMFFLLVFISRKDTLNLHEAQRSLSSAGILFGIAVGLKIWVWFYGAALILALGLTERRVVGRINVMGASGLAFLAAFLLVRGHWIIMMWAAYANPFFPHLNAIFQSPYFEPTNILNPFLFAHEWYTILTAPILLLGPGSPFSAAGEYFDIRYLVTFGMLIVIPPALWWSARQQKRKNVGPIPERQRFRANDRLVIYFFIISWVLWYFLYANAAYVLPLEMLAPVVMLIVLRRLVHPGLKRQTAILAAVLLIMLWGQSPRTQRLAWGEKYLDVASPQINAGSMIVAAGFKPWGYLVPALPPNIRFLRLQSNFTGPDRTSLVQTRAQSLIKHFRNPIYLLSNQSLFAEHVTVMKAYHLQPGKGVPIPFWSAHEREDLFLWPMTKTDSPTD